MNILGDARLKISEDIILIDDRARENVKNVTKRFGDKPWAQKSVEFLWIHRTKASVSNTTTQSSEAADLYVLRRSLELPP